MSYVQLVDIVWDSATIAVCLITVSLLDRLHSTFEGGSLGPAYRYYLLAGLALLTGVALHLVADLEGVDPSDYGLSFRDTAIVVALILIIIGLRKSVRFWSNSGPRREPGQGGSGLKPFD